MDRVDRPKPAGHAKRTMRVVGAQQEPAQRIVLVEQHHMPFDDDRSATQFLYRRRRLRLKQEECGGPAARMERTRTAGSGRRGRCAADRIAGCQPRPRSRCGSGRPGRTRKEDRGTGLEALVQSGLDRLNHAAIHLLITGQARPVRAPAGAGGPEATAGSKMGGKQRTGRRHPVFDAGRIGVGLIVVEVDIVAGDKGKLIRGEIELGRSNLLAERLRCGEIAVK